MLFYNKVLASICLLPQLFYQIYCQGPPVLPTQVSSNSGRGSSNRMNSDFTQITEGAEKFSLEFLKQMSDVHISAPTRSYMVSPYAVWSLLLLLTEAAGGTTLKELRSTLHSGNDQSVVRAAYKVIAKYLAANTTTIDVANFNAIFTDINKPVARDFENVIERDYYSALIPVKFDDTNNTLARINTEVRQATRGLIEYTVTPKDLQDAEILMISSLYFKGKWKYPFKTKDTKPLPFYDENGKVMGNVPMMTQMGLFTYVSGKQLDAHVLELPYGKENRLSMIVILPKMGVKLNRVMHNLANVGIQPILQQLKAAVEFYEDDDDKPEVEIFIPKFSIETHFSLKPVLKNMGIQNIFDARTSNLDNISRSMYVSRIIHATRIIVNEEGTEAGAVTAAVLGNKVSPSRFFVDRPFGYLIVEKAAKVLLFAGEIRNHNDNLT